MTPENKSALMSGTLWGIVAAAAGFIGAAAIGGAQPKTYPLNTSGPGFEGMRAKVQLEERARRDAAAVVAIREQLRAEAQETAARR